MRLPLPRRFVTPAAQCAARATRPQPRRRSARTLVARRRFGLAPFRSPLLGGSLLDFPSSGYLDVSVPPVAPLKDMRSPRGQQALACWVPPFGHPRIEARVRLPGDYRGLPRPSSAPCAKASAVRPARPPRIRGGRGLQRPSGKEKTFPSAMRLSRCPGGTRGAGRRGARKELGSLERR